jgi:hypothetical protein
MSSWLWGSLSFGTDRQWPVFGGYKPKTSGWRTGAIEGGLSRTNANGCGNGCGTGSGLSPLGSLRAAFAGCARWPSPVVSLTSWGDTRRGQGCSSDCQVQGERDLANYFRPLPDDYWAGHLWGGDELLPHDPPCLVAHDRPGACRWDVRTQAGQEVRRGEYPDDLPHPGEGSPAASRHLSQHAPDRGSSLLDGQVAHVHRRPVVGVRGPEERGGGGRYHSGSSRSARYCAGVRPKAALNILVKCAWSANPAPRASSPSGRSPVSC